jgi:hypothetical protein
MKRPTIVLAAAAMLLVPMTLLAQAPNEGLANAIIGAMQKNASTLRQYNWNCRTELMQNGKMVDLRIDLVNLGPGNTLQHTLLNDQRAQLPRGFLRHAIAQGQDQKAMQAVEGLHKLVEEYTQPSAGKVLEFLAGAKVQTITSPGAPTQLLVTGQDVVKGGDTFTMKLDGATMLPTSVEVSTRLHGNVVNLSGRFITTQAGVNILQYATAEIPSQNITVNIHDYDCVPIN